MGIVDRVRRALMGETKEVEMSNESPGTNEPVHRNEAYEQVLLAQREEKDHYFGLDPYSPIPHEDREGWEGLDYYPPALAYQFTLPIQREEPAPLTFQTSTGDQREYTRIGTLQFEVDGQPAQLALYEAEEGEYFLPFRDATSGNETYGAGRYLEPIPLGEGRVLLDFNLAYNPFCAYSPEYSCPLPPIENWLKLPIRAGERAYRGKGGE